MSHMCTVEDPQLHLETRPVRFNGAQRAFVADRVSPQGLHLHMRPEERHAELPGRFVWVDLELPDGTTVRALGEVLAFDGETGAFDIRFKHLFPDARDRLDRAFRSPRLGSRGVRSR